MIQRRNGGIQPLRKSQVEIIQAARFLVRRYVEELGDIAILGMNFDILYESVIYPDYGIILEEGHDLGFDSDGLKILGEFAPESNTVYIDSAVCVTRKDPRRVFTLFHEVAGHGVLQGDWLRAEFTRLRRVGRLATTEMMLDPATENSLERQANLFAGHVAAPDRLLDHWMERRLHLSGPVRFNGSGEYCVQEGTRTSNYHANTLMDVCRRLARAIQPFFGGLSIEALSYRVAERGWAVSVVQPEFRLRRSAPRSYAKSGAA
jgi:hypothetical protein